MILIKHPQYHCKITTEIENAFNQQLLNFFSIFLEEMQLIRSRVYVEIQIRVFLILATSDLGRFISTERRAPFYHGTAS